MNWLILLLAAGFECVGAVSLKASDGFRRRRAAVIFFVAMATSMSLLAWAARTIPVGTAYAVWTGIGAAGTVVWGIVRFGEPASRRRIACLAVIVAGVVLLRLAEG